MRHRIHQKKLNRTSEHRKAMNRNMAQSLIEHGRITTTLPKAKNIKPFFEKLVTLAVKARKFRAANDHAGSLRMRRQIHKMLGERSLIPEEHREDYEMMSDASRRKALRMASGRRYRTGEPKGRLEFTGESVIHRLIETVASRFEDRPGGYTRLIKLADRRVGDDSQLAIVQLIGDEEQPTSLTKPDKTSRKRRADARYALAIKLGKKSGKKDKAEAEMKSVDESMAEAPADEEATAPSDVPAGETDEAAGEGKKEE